MKRPRARTDTPRPETMAFARGLRARPATAGLVFDMPIEEELALTRMMGQRLLALLRVRDPRFCACYLDELSPDARATVDRAFEASYLLLMRHGLRVEPCRKVSWEQDGDQVRYSVEHGDGSWRIVTEDELIAQAGLAA